MACARRLAGSRAGFPVRHVGGYTAGREFENKHLRRRRHAFFLGGPQGFATMQGLSALIAASASLAITLAAKSTAPIIRRMMQSTGKNLYPMKKHTGGQPPTCPACRWISDRGLRVAAGEGTLARLAALKLHQFTEIIDMIPAEGSLLLILRPGASVSADLWAVLAAPVADTSVAMGTCHEIAVEYGGAAGPDLAALAERAGMDTVAYINSHAAVEYTVAFLGFQPGFPYLRGLPDALHAPRRASPRVRVAAGSVAIGGGYCGIYPTGGPGGWQVIARTATVLFDPAREAPALLMPGDRVRFVPR